MRLITAIGFFVFLFLNVFSQKTQNSISLIPAPVDMQPGPGSFILKPTTPIEFACKESGVEKVAGFPAKKLSRSTGNKVPVTSGGSVSGSEVTWFNN